MTGPEASTGVELPQLSSGAADAGAIPPFDFVETPAAGQVRVDGRGRKRDYKAERLKRKRGGLAADNVDGGPRKRGRPTNAERAARAAEGGQELHTGELPPEDGRMSAEEMKAFADALGLAFRLSSQLVAAKRGPHWIMEQKESELHGAAWAAALEPWAGSMGKWLPLATAGALLVSAIATRVETDAQLARQQRAPTATVDVPPAEGLTR